MPTIEDTTALLNEALQLDQGGISKLFEKEVWCNEGIVNHPTIQCKVPHWSSGKGFVGVLGVLNGIFYSEGKIIVAHRRVTCPSNCDFTEVYDNVCPVCGSPVKKGEIEKFEVVKLNPPG